MPLVIDASVGGASANSFLTLAEAQTYMDARLNGSLWDAADTDDQNRALVEATRELSHFCWCGTRVTTTQSLAWPRQWVVNPDTPAFAWAYYDTTVIPQRVKDATAELAFQFLNAGTSDLASADPNAGVVEKTIDVLTTRWAAFQRPSGWARFPRVLGYVGPLLEESSGGIDVVRG